MKKFSIIILCVASLIFGMVIAGLFDTDSRSNATPNQIQKAEATIIQAVDTCCPNFAEINKKVSPAVVAIYSSKIVKYRHPFFDDDFFKYFFGYEKDQGEEEKVQSGGSGFIISPDGYILTNNHVVADADEVDVVLENEEHIKAKVVGKDAPTDLALLKIDYKKPLPHLTLGDSDKLEIGEWVMAVGFPLAYGKTVTVGVISAKERKIGISEKSVSFENFLQTDAAINPGNSGGPLVNIRGEVVGVNTAISLAGQNIGFAVPINQFKSIENQLKTKGKVTRGYLGVVITEVTEEIKKAFKLKEAKGALVQKVEKGSPAEEAGIKHGDIIIKADKKDINKPQDLIDYIASQKPGTNVKVVVLRDGKERDFDVKLGLRKEEGEEEMEQKEEQGEGRDISKLGITIDEISPRYRSFYRIPEEINGVLVLRVKRISKAYERGLREGDVIMEANGKEIKTPQDLKKVYKSLSKDEYLNLYVYKPGKNPTSIFIIIPVEE